MARVERDLAHAATLRGCLDDALRLHVRAGAAFRRLEDEPRRARTDRDLAEIHLRMGAPEDARVYAERAERRFRHLGDGSEAALAAVLEGQSREMSRDLAGADSAYRRAGDAFGALGLDHRRSSCDLRRANVAEMDGRIEDTRRLLSRAEVLYDARVDPLRSAPLELLRARVVMATGGADTAIRLAREVRDACRCLHAPWIQIEANRLMGRALAEENRLREALDAYLTAVEHLESYRGGVPLDENMSAFLAGRRDLDGSVVELLDRLGEGNAARAFTERARPRPASGPGSRSPDGEGAALTALRIRALGERLNAAYTTYFRRCGGADPASIRVARRVRERAGRLESEMTRLVRGGDPVAPEGPALDLGPIGSAASRVVVVEEP